MTKRDNSTTCPLGETQCIRLDELAHARHEVTELAEMVIRDALTGLFNFRHFSTAMEQEMERTQRTRQPMSLAILDLDHFKRINDTWGHETGNLVLKQVAAIIAQHTRKIDIPCRYGGEEFALILPGTKLLHAVEIAERIRRGIEATPLSLDQEDIHFTGSIGVTVYQPEMHMKAEQLIAQADGFLYEAKQGGRNQVRHLDYKTLHPRTEVTAAEKAALFS